ncbi:DUF3987 domain-containing protein [Pseudomonas aeruginosa]
MFYESVENLQVPMGHILTALLSTMSAVTMGLADVLMPDGERCPLGLYGLVVAPTGAGKTTVLKYLTKPLLECEQEEYELYQRLYAEWKAEDSIFKAKEIGLMRRITKAVSKGESTVEDECELKALQAARKVEPKNTRLMTGDIESDYLFDFLHKNQSPVFISTAEARRALLDLVVRSPEKLASLFSNEEVRIDQNLSRSYVVKNARAAIYFATQPGVMSDFMSRHGGTTREAGLWARFIIFADDSISGGVRSYCRPVLHEHYDLYVRRIKELRRKGCALKESANAELALLKLSPAASRKIDSVSSIIAAQSCPGGRFYRIQDFAKRIPEKAIRISGVFHLVEGYEGDISLETLNIAINICFWYADEFERLFVGPTPEEQCEQAISCKIQEMLFRKGKYIKRNDLLQRVPKAMRSKDLLYPVLDRLAALGLIYEFEMNRTQCINLNFASGHNDAEARMAMFGSSI